MMCASSRDACPARARLRVSRQVQQVHLVGDHPVVAERDDAQRAAVADDVDVGPVAPPSPPASTWAVIGRCETTRRSIAITASRSASRIGSTSNACWSLLTAMAAGFPHDAKRPAAPPQVRPAAAAPDGVEDRRPQRVDALAGLTRHHQRPRGAAAAPERRPRALAQQAALAGGQLVDLREHDLGGDVLRPQPFVELPLLVLDPAARVDQDDEQRQRAARRACSLRSAAASALRSVCDTLA